MQSKPFELPYSTNSVIPLLDEGFDDIETKDGAGGEENGAFYGFERVPLTADI